MAKSLFKSSPTKGSGFFQRVYGVVKLVPCHRVVNKDGRLAPNYAFDGRKEQKMKLDVEGVKFVDEMHIDLKKSGCVD